MKELICLLFCCLLFLPAAAQWKWHNPMEAGFPVIQNQGFTKEIGNSYTRLPERAKGVVSEPVWNLSRHSAGLAIHFYSNAPQIKVRYTVTGSLNMPHMPSTGVSGVDLYSINSDGEWHFCFGNYSFKDTITYTYNNIGKDRYHKQGFEYRLYLPLYNGVKWLEIGIPEDAKLEFIPVSPEKPIVLYGTSIAQGACASRPAMAWGTILQRSLDYPLINLGFSGNGKLAKEVLQFIGEMDARLYILDCMPNLPNQKEEDVTALAIAAVKQLREKHSAPILLIEHGGYSNMYMDSIKYNEVTQVNRASRKAYEQIQSEGIKDVYYLSREDLNIPSDGWVDYVHPSDFGMKQQAVVVERKVREILHIPLGSLTTTIPVTQRREPHMYEWLSRHRAFLEQVRNHPPKAVILGNSITHYWGGEPEHRNKNGREGVPADRLSGADDHLAAARERLVRRSVGRHAAGGREAGAGGSRRHRRAGDAAGQHPRFAGRGGRCGLAVRIRLPAVAARDHVAHSRDGARDDGCVRRGGCDVLRVVRRASAGCRRNLFGRL